MARLSLHHRTLIYLSVVAAGLVATGCQDVDWDWESRWWQKPTREVKPDRRVARDGRTTPTAAPQQSPPESPQPSAQQPVVSSAPPPSNVAPPTATENPSSPGTAEEVRADERVELTTTPPPAPGPAPVPAPAPAPSQAPVREEPRATASITPSQPPPPVERPRPAPVTPPPPPAQEQIASARTNERMAIPDRPATPEPPPVQAPAPSEPILSSGPDVFYQLYLMSEPSSQRAAPNTQRVQLANAPARVAAQIISQLYQPVGLGGGDRQTYLIYQDLDEWRAAQGAVAWVDVASGGSSGLSRGMRSLIDVVGAGPMPDREAVNAAHTAFSQVVGDTSADSRSRWAAAMWDGKLASEQLFDDTAAAASYEMAIKLASPGTVERLAALWARAESYQAVGDREAARKAYGELASEFAGAHPRSHAVQRASVLRSGGGR